ncbi:MAG: DMT family transporter [Cyanobacteria bacterium P01_G01_bin.19]
MKKPTQWEIIIALIVGVIGVSSAAIWVRLAVDTANPDNKVGFSVFLAASRLIFSALILLTSWRKLKPSKISSTNIYYAIAAGICLAVHFATWITSLTHTSIAASTVLVTTNPIWVGLINWWWYKEKLNRQNIIGIAIALGGGVIIAIADRGGIVSNYSNPLLGNSLALVGAIMSSLYIIFGSQAQRQGLNTASYIAIAYSVAAICLFPLPFLYQTSYLNHSVNVYIFVILMAIVSQLIGHTTLNWLVRWVSPTIISLSLLFEPVVASLVGAIVFQEIPAMSVLIGGLIILTGIATFLLPNK